MQTLRKIHGYPTIRRALRFLSIRLKSRPPTKPFAADVDAMRTELEAAKDRHEQALEERVAQTAEIGYLDSLTDACVMDVSREFNVMSAGKPNDERRALLFRTAPSEAIKDTASDTQTIFVKTLIHALSNEPQLAPLKPLADPLAQSLDVLGAAVKHREELAVPEARAAAQLQLTLEKARRLYNRMHPQLTLLLGEEALVESFFATLKTAGGKPVAEETEEEEAGEG